MHIWKRFRQNICFVSFSAMPSGIIKMPNNAGTRLNASQWTMGMAPSHLSPSKRRTVGPATKLCPIKSGRPIVTIATDASWKLFLSRTGSSRIMVKADNKGRKMGEKNADSGILVILFAVLNSPSWEERMSFPSE